MRGQILRGPLRRLQAGEALTALRFDDSGLHCAVGTGDGLVALFDLRSSRPLLVKDHMYSSAILDLKFHNTHGSAGRTLGTLAAQAPPHIPGISCWA